MSSKKNKVPKKELSRDSLAYKILSIGELPAIVPLIILIFIGIAINPNFMNKANWWALFRMVSFMGLPGVAVAILLTTKGFDLSVGQVVNCGGTIFALMCCQMGVPVWLAFILTLLFGLCIGLINGFFIIKIGIPNFLATLAMEFALLGICNELVKGVSIAGFPEWFVKIGAWKLFDFITIEMLFFAAAIIFGYLLMKKTVLGHQIQLIGTNDRAAALCGMNVNKVRMGAYVAVSIMAAFSAVLFCARTGQAASGTGGEWPMQISIAALIGGTSNYGGRCSIIGVLFGVLYMRILMNVLIMGGFSSDWQYVGMGLTMILAILFDYWRMKVTRTQVQ